MSAPQHDSDTLTASSPKRSRPGLHRSPSTYPRPHPEGSARRVREGGFYPQALEKVLRSERALMLALAEMHRMVVQGVSTRMVALITESLYASGISSTQVHRTAALLDEVLWISLR